MPPDKAARFLRAYKELLSAAVGRPLDNQRNFADARNVFFESESLLKDPPTEDFDLLEALKTACFGRFVVCRHLVRWTEMIGPDNRVYRVSGITSELRDLTPQWGVVQTAVMQFQETWICDGLLESYNLFIGPGMRKNLMEKIRESAPTRRKNRSGK